MCNQQNDEAIDRSNRLPSIFAVHSAIPTDERMMVFKNEDRGFEVDPMFCHVPPVLSFIPVKSHVVTIR
jgi:hypothetical protein